MKLIRLIRASIKYIFSSNYRFVFNSQKNKYKKLPDETYLKKMFKATIGNELDLDNPKTFNEKLQWLKLYDRKPEYNIYVDKYRVRDYIANILGEEYLIPLIGVWDNPDDIDFDKLPDRFVLKCNHNSGLGMCICKDKSKLDINRVKSELRKGLSQDYYLYGREWPYKDVPRKIIAEEYIAHSNGEEIKDYKLWCFSGKVKVILTCSERFSKTGLKENFYTPQWELLDLKRPKHSNTDHAIPMPININKMIDCAELLSAGHKFLRVDFYEVDGRIYFGELTFFPASGFEKFEPREWDDKLGEAITLPERKNEI